MNSKYYTSVDIINNQYFGKVFESSNNALVYTSKPYNTQEQAIADARSFILKSAPPTANSTPQTTITSTSNYTTPRYVHGKVNGGRCCGR